MPCQSQTRLKTTDCCWPSPDTPVLSAVPQFPHRQDGCEAERNRAQQLHGLLGNFAPGLWGSAPKMLHCGEGSTGPAQAHLGRCGAAADGSGGVCFTDMLQLINTPDNDFSGLFDSPFSAPDSAVPSGLPSTPGTLNTFLGPSKPPPAAPSGSAYVGSPGMAAFAPQPPAPLLPAPSLGVKEEPSVVPSSQPQPQPQPQPAVMLAPSFVPASPSPFTPQPLVGYQKANTVENSCEAKCTRGALACWRAGPGL